MLPCKVGGHWHDKLWAEVSLLFTNIPRHRVRCSCFPLGNWFVWVFIGFKKNNSLVIYQVTCFYILALAFIKESVYLQKIHQEMCVCAEYSPSVFTEKPCFPGGPGNKKFTNWWNKCRSTILEHTYTNQKKIILTIACKYYFQFQP